MSGPTKKDRAAFPTQTFLLNRMDKSGRYGGERLRHVLPCKVSSRQQDSHSEHDPAEPGAEAERFVEEEGAEQAADEGLGEEEDGAGG